MHRSTFLSLSLSALVLLLPARPIEAGCTNSTRTGATSVPEFGPNNIRLWGALEPVDQGAIPGRRDSTQEIDGFEFPNSGAPAYRDVDHAAGFLITTMPYGYELWRIQTPAQKRDPLHVDTRDGYSGDFETWQGVQGENNRVFGSGDAYLTSDNHIIFLEAGLHGLAIWEIPVSSPTSPRLLFQEWSSTGGLRVYRDVEVAQINGVIYGFAVAGQFTGGVHVFNISAARGLSTPCVDDIVGGDSNCGVYAGSFSAPGSSLGFDVGVQGTTLVYTASSLQTHLYDLSNSAVNPTRLGQVGGQSFNSDIWVNSAGQVGVATRDATNVRIWDVTTCANTGSCGTVGTLRFSDAVGGYLNPERLMASESGNRDFLYSLQSSGCPGRREREHLYDVSNLTTVVDVMPHTTDTFVDGGDSSVVSYSAYYSMGSPATGFRFVQPWGGTFVDQYFYRAQLSIFDVHELVQQDPQITVTGPAIAYLNQNETYTAAADFCDAGTGTWTWQAGAGASITGTGSSVSISWSSLGDRTVTATNTACAGAAVTGQDVSVLDPAPVIEQVRVNGNVLPASAPWTGSDICDLLVFDATVTGQPTLNYAWEVQDVVNNSAVVASGNASTLSWDSASQGTTMGGAYDLELMLSNSVDETTAIRSLVLNDLPDLAYGGVDPECGAINGACSTQTPAGSGTINLFANSEGANAWRWEWRPQSGGSYTMIADFGVGQPEQTTSLPTGDYEIRSTIRNCVNETLQSTFQVTVDAEPIVANFVPGCPFACEFDAPRTVFFDDMSTGDISLYEYDFLNTSSSAALCDFTGGSSSPVTTFTYTTPGTYRPCLRASNAGETDIFVYTDGILIRAPDNPSINVSCPSTTQVGQNVTCTASASDCSPSATGWNWTTTGGSISGTNNGSQISLSWSTTGLKTVRATNSQCTGASGTDTVNVQSDGGGGGTLSADFTFSPESPVTDDTITLNGSASTGDIIAYLWTVTPPSGPNLDLSGVNTTFVPDAPGDWRVNLLVLDQLSCTNPSCSDDVTRVITVGGEVLPVTARLSVDPATPVVGQQVTVDTSASTGTVVERFVTITAPGGGQTQYEDQEAPRHTFESVGTHTVRLRVTNSRGCSSEDCESIVSLPVQVAAAVQPTATIGVLPNEPVVNETVTLDASGSTGPIVNRDWTIEPPSGPDILLSGTVVNFVPTQTGVHRVRLLVETADGCVSAACEAVANRDIDVLAFAPLTARIAVSPDPPRMNEPIVFSASASGGNPTSFEWTINGLQLQGETVSFFTTSMGDLDVTLTVRRGGDTDSTQQIIPVFGPCVDGESTLCVGQGRFRVTATWQDATGNAGVGSVRGERTPNSGLFWFFNQDNIEQLVKVLDGCAFNDHFWVLAASLTDVAYDLVVEDLIGDATFEFNNALGTASPAIVNTSALPTCGAMASTAPEPLSLTVLTGVERDAALGDLRVLGPEAAEPALGDLEVVSAADGFCNPGETQACLIDSRFRAEISFSTLDGQSGLARVSAIESDTTGVFYFFDPNNLELVAKVIDGCALNDRFWVFAAATTDQQYTLRVTDTLTGQIQEYRNELGETAAAVNDTDAFATCDVN